MTRLSITSLRELVLRLAELGYEIDKDDSFEYENTYNADPYPAYSCYIVEKDTQLSFAHVNARKDENFRKLQELRMNAEVVIKGRVYEL